MSRPNWIGKTLGNRYQIQEILGQGGMSAVYKALDPNLQRVVAVKLIHPHLSEDPKFISRFEEEARSVAQLRHPNITQIYDFNHDGDVYYMVQEFVPGETLQERLRRLNRDGRPMALADAVRFTMDICSAMGYAHDRGLIHRDIKPANIMLDVQGKAILMDFGIVKIVGGSSHTTTGAVVGTAMYMAPDVIRGETPDARSDIYSLGVTLFEMVSGRPPFKADSAMSLMMMHLHDPLPDLHNLRPETPDDLIAVIEKSLAKGRADRYQSAQEMWAVLKRVLDRLEGGVSPVMAQVVQPPSRLAPNQSATQLEPQAPGSGQVVGAASAPPGPAKPPERTLRESELAQRAQQSQVGRPGAASDPGISGPTRMEVSPAPPLMASGAYPQEQQGAARPAGSGAVPPSSASPARPAAPAAAKPVLAKPALLAGGGIVLVLILFCLVAGGLAGGYMLNRAGMFTGATDTPAATLTATQTSAVVAPLLQATTATSSPTSEAATAPALPTPTPTPEFIPTITIPAGIHFARINTIELDDQGRYIVSYETSEFTEQLPGEHVHFFFNTVPPEQAGVPGKGPWILYGGPRPFSQYKASDRPQNASQMCILVANPNHSVQPDSGNCLPLPDVPAVTMRSDSICRAGPGEAYGSVAPLSFRTTVLLRGLSMDEGWWFIQNPESFSDSCWIPISLAAVSGDISQLQVIEAPALPTDVPAASQSVEITGITVDSQNRYVVDFVTQNFTPQIPGVHIHFFFNTVSPDQVGLGGSGDRLMFGGPSPFTGYTVSDRPAGATQMCATVVNPDHSVIPNSGNCFDLPSTPLAGLPVP